MVTRSPVTHTMIDRPMKPQWFQILLALSARQLHGYGIQRAVLEQTDEGMTLWPAMLYRSLSTLEDEGLVSQVPTPDDEPEDERRQYYALTAAGTERLGDEAELMMRWAHAARQAGA